MGKMGMIISELAVAALFYAATNSWCLPRQKDMPLMVIYICSVYIYVCVNVSRYV